MSRHIFISRVQERSSVHRLEARRRIEEWLSNLQDENTLTGQGLIGRRPAGWET
jgi:hypothetical protein